ncbi:cobalamin biosynthesis protein [Streptomyces sp. NBC_01198]|uniref:cobalamin biosynthesis protein n=1 Tax=Streptomyces sp. NBC_01198 TaxID=2903769 RepID=UPI002E14EEBD|nr:cobalamin biosynthesis protein [Streptomyces sp. NBC_01198]
MRADRVYAYGAALGFLGDLVAGDPRRGHPVAAFGRAAGAVERRMWRDDRLSGAVYAALCAGAVAGAVALAGRAVRPNAALSAGLTAACTWSVLGGTSLAREARAVAAALDAGDVEAARARLPHLCGRDPQHLDADQIARAVVESVAENTSDAVVGALVWGAVGGLPGLAGFRAVNTLDAMVGHRSPRHLRFGWAAARLDDAAGWPGARLTAALAALASPHPMDALRTWRRDAAAHPSPNAGPVEAAFAGALRLRLGGTLSYAGRTEHRPVLGAGYPSPTPADIPRAIALSRRVSALSLALTVSAALLLPRLRPAAGGPVVPDPAGPALSVRPALPALPALRGEGVAPCTG